MSRLKMRLEGTQEEISDWLRYQEKLQEKSHLKVIQVSRFYQNKGVHEQYRCYVEVEMLLAIPG